MTILAPKTDEERAALEGDLEKAKAAFEAAFKEKCDEIEAAFNRLSVPSADGDGIPYRELVPGIARELMLMRAIQKQKRAPAKRSLQKTVQLMERTAEALDSLPPDTLLTWLAVSNVRPEAFRQFKLMLKILPVNAQSAGRAAIKGQPPKTQAAKIALRVGEHYHALTGKKPTVSSNAAKDGAPCGPYFELLSVVFKVLDMKGVSAASQGKKVQRELAGGKRRKKKKDE